MIKAYMSHPIRGSMKDKATSEFIESNCAAAMKIAGSIRTYVGVNYRDADFELYVPAEHEAFVHRTYTLEMLRVQQILYIDCKIIEEDFNDLLLIFAPFGPPVEGCHVEFTCARSLNIPVIVFKDLEEFKDKIEAYLEARGIYE